METLGVVGVWAGFFLYNYLHKMKDRPTVFRRPDSTEIAVPAKQYFKEKAAAIKKWLSMKLTRRFSTKRINNDERETLVDTRENQVLSDPELEIKEAVATNPENLIKEAAPSAVLLKSTAEPTPSAVLKRSLPRRRTIQKPSLRETLRTKKSKRTERRIENFCVRELANTRWNDIITYDWKDVDVVGIEPYNPFESNEKMWFDLLHSDDSSRN